ncbi:MAG: sulfite exporter TauE/SafE family protein [Sphingomonadaceae bacterium]
MDLFAALDLPHAVAGLLVGTLVGLTGVGGGSLMTPLLVLMFGVSPQTAVGTDLLFAAVTKLVGVAVHHHRQTVDWRIFRRLAIGSVPAAIVTLGALASFVRIGDNANKVIITVLGAMLLVTATGLMFQRKLLAYGATHPLPAAERDKAAMPTIVLGVLLGVLVTISSIGAGAIGATILVMLYRRAPIARIVGTDIAHAVPLALIAGLGHWLLGKVDFALLANLLIGSIPGVIVGSLLSSRAPDKLLRIALAAVLTVSGFRLLVQ